MKTIKLPYKSSIDLTPILKQYSSVVRWSYNRFINELKEKEVRQLSKTLQNVELLNSWVMQCAILDGKAIHKRFKNKKIIFGGKHNFINRLKHKISKEEFSVKRSSPVNIQGETLQKGNRSFKLDIIDNNCVIFKLNKTDHITLELPNLRNNIKQELYKLQQLNEIKSGTYGHTYSIRLDTKHLYISFEEFKGEVHTLDEQVYMGIDLNPNTIGISILKNEQIIHTQEFSLKQIFAKIFNDSLASSSKEMKYLQNKLNFETIEISKAIASLAKQYGCGSVYVEDLKFKMGSAGLGKVFNRKTKNLWKKTVFIGNLTKRLKIGGIGIHAVNPAYSSFIGNFMYDYTDPVNASIEIARRGFEYRIKKNKNSFYPTFSVKHHWKEMIAGLESWKELYLKIKNLKLKYRVSLDEVNYDFRVFSLNHSRKSLIESYTFYPQLS